MIQTTPTERDDQLTYTFDDRHWRCGAWRNSSAANGSK